jgi:predicted DNA-binding transcriptional regulator AlpA
MSAYLDTEQIAKLLGLSREYVTDKLTKRSDFPPPAINRNRRLRRWAEADVMDWARGSQGSRAAMSSADSRGQ